MRRYLLSSLVALLPMVAAAAPAPSVYVCAHPDDCFLFMSPDLYNDTVAGRKVVVLYLTSGDAGLAFEAAESSYPYGRERASLEATEWMADADREAVRAAQQNDTVDIQGHRIDRVRYANTVSYFLRLPDGDMYGKGFPRYDGASLQKLRRGEIDTLAPIDGRKPYRGWGDLLAVLSDIFTRETQGARNVTLHISDPDTTKNEHDHADHTAGANAVMDMLAQGDATRCYQLYAHIDYAIAQKPVNLDGEALQNKAGSFAVLTAHQRRFLDAYNWDAAHRPYLTRNYATATSQPQGCDRAP